MAQAPPFKGNTYREFPQLNAWAARRMEPALEPDLAILDAHHHFWDDASRGRYLVDDLRADIESGHNIVATVYVETRSRYLKDGPRELWPIGEVRFAADVGAASEAGRYGKTRFCAGIVGHADLTLGDAVQPVLEALIEAGHGRLRGIRYTVAWDPGHVRVGQFKEKHQAPPHQLQDPAFRKGLACLRTLGLAYDVSILYPQLDDLVDLLRAFPETSVVLNHLGAMLGVPPHDNREEVFRVWSGHVRRLAPFPNLSMKIGGLGMLRSGFDFHTLETPPSSEELAAAWRPYVETCIEAFGPERCMVESNFPPDKQSCGYGVLWNAMKRITQNYSTAEKTALYSGTAARVYQIKV